MEKKAIKRKKKQAHKKDHAIDKDILMEEFGPEFGDMNAIKAYENAIESNSKKGKC
ncbi:hypothetical protein ACWE42_22840 [Sutcliffiella cohnii]|uniref:hypothetical protein n=1 Tax=Sutcliffiella TaxID=2837511 RepID=UPI000A81D1A5|nr:MULTISPECIES: hypothetical protein [Sutcliffiella]MED4015021.1 hypothetical protein [Sutcliffiella cohnii]WBL17247.1 hypothetical protein O1A01_11705 [Sutcliffiella sp. NC1]